MPPIKEQAPILYRNLLRDNVVDLILRAEGIAAQARPGQFVHIKCGDDMLLRRPISLCDVEDGTIRLVIESAGVGTEWLRNRQAGDVLDLLGPLGDKGFPIPGGAGDAVLMIGGGCGVAPLLYSAKHSPVAVDMVMGFGSADLVIMEQDFKNCCRTVTVCTDDGTYGRPGFVTEAALQLLEEEDYQAIFSCGNMEMLKAVADVAAERDIPCYLSLDERMGCGLGACLVCAVKTRGEDGAEHYSHACKQGPVFELREVVWE